MIMRNTLILSLIVLGLCSTCLADVYKTIYNPFTDAPDYVTVLAPNLSSPPETYTGFTFDGTNFCLWVNGVDQQCWVQSPEDRMLLESTGNVLLENGTYLLLEN